MTDEPGGRQTAGRERRERPGGPDAPRPRRLLSNAPKGNGIGAKGLRTKPKFLEPCRAEKNKGSNMHVGS